MRCIDQGNVHEIDKRVAHQQLPAPAAGLLCFVCVVFTTTQDMCVTEDALGVAKDELAAKPLVLYEGDDMVALASEEIAIRAVIDHEIYTYDPYESEVLVWTR